MRPKLYLYPACNRPRFDLSLSMFANCTFSLSSLVIVFFHGFNHVCWNPCLRPAGL